MITKLNFFFGLGMAATCLLFGAGCERETKTPILQATPEPARTAPIDICGLITTDEFTAAQGMPIKDKKESSSVNGQFLVKQCFYEATEFSKSINLAVTSHAPDFKGQQSLAEFWKEKFSAQKDAGALAGNGPEPEGEEKREPPKKITGLGDDAYWMGRDALYVLKGNVYLRLSIGGPESVEAKIEKAKKLVQQALDRL